MDLPYEFDLCFNIKTLENLIEKIKYIESERAELIELCTQYDLNYEEMGSYLRERIEMECKLCGEEINQNCTMTEIDVYFVFLVGDPSLGYYERDFHNVKELNHGYEWRKEKMMADKYFNMPEFTGF